MHYLQACTYAINSFSAVRNLDYLNEPLLECFLLYSLYLQLVQSNNDNSSNTINSDKAANIY